MLPDSRPKHIYEPTSLQCGQAVLAMLTGKTVEDIVKQCLTENETTFKDMKRVLELNGIGISSQRMTADNISDLPKVALLSLETPKCWHWSLYFDGTVLDPEHGILSDFPECNRKYFWELTAIK